jgi:hypothetical protein
MVRHSRGILLPEPASLEASEGRLGSLMGRYDWLRRTFGIRGQSDISRGNERSRVKRASERVIGSIPRDKMIICDVGLNSLPLLQSGAPINVQYPGFRQASTLG